MTDPIEGSQSYGRVVHGVLCLHVDDLVMTGDAAFTQKVLDATRKAFEVGSADRNDCEFCGQRIRKRDGFYEVDQQKAIEELREVDIDKDANDSTPCNSFHAHGISECARAD